MAPPPHFPWGIWGVKFGVLAVDCAVDFAVDFCRGFFGVFFGGRIWAWIFKNVCRGFCRGFFSWIFLGANWAVDFLKRCVVDFAVDFFLKFFHAETMLREVCGFGGS